MAPARWNALTAADQAVFLEAAKGAGAAMRGEVDRMERESLSLLRAGGMEITTVDRTLFEKAVAPVYADCARRFGQERIDRIRKYQN